MQRPPTVYVMCQADYARIESMIAALSRALETIFDRRLVEPLICPDDTGDFDEVTDKAHRDYLF